jgi:ferric iron reductase protein FhuF
MRSTRDVCEALDRIASGPYSEFSGRLVADDDPRRSVTADGLLDATMRSAIEARFARRFAHFDPRAVHSIWVKWYVYAVVPPFLLADLLLQRTLPAALDQTRFIIGDDDRVAALVIAGPGIDTTATPPFDRLDELVFGHFAPLIDLWITRTDLTRRVLWSNVGNTFEAMVRKLEEVTGPFERLRQLEDLLTKPTWYDGRRNPLHDAVRYRRHADGSNKRLRRVCCLQYMLPDRQHCSACPVVPRTE